MYLRLKFHKNPSSEFFLLAFKVWKKRQFVLFFSFDPRIFGFQLFLLHYTLLFITQENNA